MLAFLQKIGRSLMLPVATLPAAALLLRFGAINYETEFHMGATVGGFLNQYVAPFLLAGGSAIFDNLSLIFAIGVAIGLAGDAVAALAAVIAYQVLVTVLGKVPAAFAFIPDDAKLNMGVLGGILAGGVAAYFYNKYHDIKLPDWLGFFGGKRFVPIVTSVSMVIIALLFGLIWGPIQDALHAFGEWVVNLGAVGAGVFMFFNRILIPFGLHHVINAIAWFQIGDFTDAAGQVWHGDLNRFFHGDKNAGMFMTGFFPIMMFALPGAALAIIHTAKPEKRKAIASVFLGTALTSFLTGITEPIEFAFMFVAPALYVVHAVLTGVSGYLVTAMGIKHGFGFSAGFIDYVVNYPLATKPLLLIPIGLVFAVVYYFLFRIMIVKLNLMTPGREEDEFAGETGAAGASSLRDKAEKVLALIGGKENITSIDACITRLRLVLKDDTVVDEKGLKAIGAAGVMKLGQGSVQVVFGTQSELLKDEIKKL
ncbi:PTS transporter subunit EIIC [Brevibacillus sp. SYP-B805]|uniref:N-acetylglucosamine-specific PTS transporter subunit IIBC n=1 Tax=Brevibacillus sp. SYP-B805 TaxID=1578199 RepID=UPI0013EC2EE7|nr:N-acetylglucosamine-specific PTS transporter subunit IIBC [Brevibacillus sp. SYP-B805]NGQ96981.1 PTS transporter subunit EIIC [Brevibacillus sp. SYP-B805]